MMATSAYTGNPNIARQGARARQIAQARNVSDIADPRTYGFMQGLLGSAPDQLGYSIFDDPETRRAAQQAAEIGLIGGGLLQGLPVIGPAVKGYGRLLGSEINKAMLGEGGLLGPITPQVMYVVPPGKKMPSPYPQQQALDLAQQRAALPVEQGGLGLPASNTPEMRAKAMGFDKDVYHGAQNEITNIDFALAGQNTGNPNATLGFFTTPNTEEASRYATLHGNKTNANVIPLVAKSENSYQMPYKELDDLAMDQYNLMMQSPDYNPNEVVKFGDMAAQKAAAERLKKYRDIASEKSLQRKNELMQEGFDSATVLQGKPMEEFIIFNPDSIRSRFAAFDPFRRNAAIAAAMGVAAPNLLAQEQPQSSGLLYPFP